MTRLQLLCTGAAPLTHRGSSYLVQTGDETLVSDGQATLRRALGLEKGAALLLFCLG